MYLICKYNACGRVFTNPMQTKWMYYNCFVLWCVSGSKASLACVWHDGEWFYTASPVPKWRKWFSWWKALGFYAVKSEWIYHADLCKLPTLYKCTFDTTKVGFSHYMHDVCTASWLIIYVWLPNTNLLGA